MSAVLVLKAVILGIVEGATEFLPVSSTAHLILASELLRYPQAQRVTTELFIQLGSILAVVWHFRNDLLVLVARAPRDAHARDFLLKIMVAFLPAAVVGLAIHHAIEEHLFTPGTVAGALIAGGVVLLLVEARPRRPVVHEAMETTWEQAAVIGGAQVASLVPGVSRAGATIVGGLLSGLDRPAATLFSFYLAIPTVGAASLFGLGKALPMLTRGDAVLLAIGFASAFVSALIVVRGFLAYVRTHDFTIFGYYRILLGTAVYVMLVAARG